MPVPFKVRLRHFLSRAMDSLCALAFCFAAAILPFIAFDTGMSFGAKMFRLVECAIVMILNSWAVRDWWALRKVDEFSKPLTTDDRQWEKLCAAAIVNLNSIAFFGAKENGLNTFENKCRLVATLQMTNEGVAEMERAISSISPYARREFIMGIRQLWTSLEFRMQMLCDAANAGKCDVKYASEQVRIAEAWRDALVATELYARSVQAMEKVKGSFAGLMHGYREPRLREAMWKASQYCAAANADNEAGGK